MGYSSKSLNIQHTMPIHVTKLGIIWNTHSSKITLKKILLFNTSAKTPILPKLTALTIDTDAMKKNKLARHPAEIYHSLYLFSDAFIKLPFMNMIKKAQHPQRLDTIKLKQM